MSIEDIEPAQDTLPAPRKTPSRPGVLRGEVWLTVHTRQAQLLIHGRKGTRLKRPRGLPVSQAPAHHLGRCACRRKWADWWRKGRPIENPRLHRCEGAELGPHAGGCRAPVGHPLFAPARTRLQFANPYAYQGAQLLSQYDALACRVLTANRIGLLDNATRNDVLTDCARKLRAIYMIPRSYRFTGVDRSALLAGKGTIRTACWTMGEVPDAVLHGEHLPPLAPRKSGAPTASAQI